MQILGYTIFALSTILVLISLKDTYKNNSGLSAKKLCFTVVVLWSMYLLSALLFFTLSAGLLLLSLAIIITLHLVILRLPHCKEAVVKKSKIRSIMQSVEACFDILYLVSGLIISLILINSRTYGILPGIMGFVLIIGDSFHLLPRIHLAFGYDRQQLKVKLGIGKQVASISMTVFYLLLWHILQNLFFDTGLVLITTGIYVLAVLRIMLCLLPQNKWERSSSAARFSVVRNMPFLLMGLVVFVFSSVYANSLFGYNLSIAVLLSFAFYLPVVLWSSKHPMIGMLMLPKSVVYIWLLTIFI